MTFGRVLDGLDLQEMQVPKFTHLIQLLNDQSDVYLLVIVKIFGRLSVNISCDM